MIFFIWTKTFIDFTLKVDSKVWNSQYRPLNIYKSMCQIISFLLIKDAIAIF